MSSHSSAAAVSEKSVWDGGASPMGASYGKLMMWFFLLSDAFTFSGLLITYGLVRASHPAFEGLPEAFAFSTEYWPVPEKVFEAVPFLHGYVLPLVFVGIMTFILIMSSVTMVLAVEAGHRMDRKAVEKWMLWTIIGGLTFLGCQAWEWTHFIVGTDTPTMDYKRSNGGVFKDQSIWPTAFC
jgi:cytochrome c oxidase subunit III